MKKGDTIRYRDLKDKEKLIRMLNRKKQKYLVDPGSRTVHITKAPGKEEENGNDKDDH